MHQEQETDRRPPGGPGEESGLGDERTAKEVQEIQDAASKVEKGVEVGGGGGGGEEEEEKTKDEGEIVTHASDLHPSLSAEEERTSCESPREEASTETTTPSPNPDPPHPPTQRGPPRGTHLTKRDKKIIQKIRSYYEAAAGEEEEEQEEEQGDGGSQRKRGSSSQIPSGLVKESASRYDVSGHQGEPESGPCQSDTTEGTDGDIDPETSVFTQHAENDVRDEEPIHGLEVDAGGQTSAPIQDMGTPNQETPNQETPNQGTPNQETLNQETPSQGTPNQETPNQGTPNQGTPNQETLQLNRPVEEKDEILGKNGKVFRGPSEEVLEEQQTSVLATGEPRGEPGAEPYTTRPYSCTDEPIKCSAGNLVAMNGHEPNRTGRAEPNGSHKETPTPVPATEQCLGTEADAQSTWTTTKHRDLERTSENLEGLPTQMKVGRWSRHSRIVTANRVLFKGMGSDVAGIGLFETGPVVDPILMENSERILSKVQTLACMYSAKARTMKVPLQQKRAGNVWNQSGGSGRSGPTSGRLSGYPTQTQTEGHLIPFPTQMQNPTKYRQQTQYREVVGQSETRSEAKCGTQTHSETKVQSQTRNQMWSQTHYQNQNQIKTYRLNQTTRQEDRRTQEERTESRAEILTNGTSSKARRLVSCSSVVTERHRGAESVVDVVKLERRSPGNYVIVIT